MDPLQDPLVDLHEAVGSHEYVVRRDIAVDDIEQTTAIIGELVATYVLRRILVDAGEIEAGAPSVGAGA